MLALREAFAGIENLGIKVLLIFFRHLTLRWLHHSEWGRTNRLLLQVSKDDLHLLPNPLQP